MRSRQGAVLESLQRAQTFLDKNATLLAPVVESTGKQLEEVVDLLTTHAVNQDGGARAIRGETARQRRLRVFLRFSHMRPIAEVAKLKLRDVPNFTASTMPPYNATPQRLIAAAGAMADTAAPHEAVLVAAGLPSDFGRKRCAHRSSAGATIAASGPAPRRASSPRSATGAWC